MWLKLFITFVPLTAVWTFQQKDYVIDFYRVEITEDDPEIFGEMKSVTYKYNRTQTALNVTFSLIKDIGDEAEMVAIADKFVSNEYRDFPIRFQFNLCQGLKENHFGMAKFYELGNFPKCPIQKGSYYFGNWYPDTSKFPPFIPNGKYRLTLEILYREKKVLNIRGYGEVLRPIAVKNKQNKKN